LLSAEQASHVIRKYWGVENRLHYGRDAQLNKGASRIRCNLIIFGLLRSFALNLFRFNKEDNISRALYDNALSLDNLLGYAGI
jgi:predicted transposase YbfD/YdcC